MESRFPDQESWRPRIFDTGSPEDRSALDALRASGRVWQAHDMLERQASDLARARAPGADDSAITRAASQILNDERLGRWVYYPWSGRLVRLLAPEAFRALRLNRNCYKITPEEQARLGRLTVAVAGLSAGHAVAATLALEGACGHLKLADFDQLELSNMNRVRAGVHEIGLPKTVSIARQIMEIDPYLQLTLFPHGVTRANVDDFLGGHAPADIVVDECDSLDIKMLLRERARALGLPVIMETSDRGMQDVERFDLEPDRPILHGRLGPIDSRALEQLSPSERLDIALQIVGAETLSTRIAASMPEIGSTLVTWPQLASDVMLGGAGATAAVRRIALGQPLPSGRRYVDLDALQARAPVAPAPPAAPDTSPDALPDALSNDASHAEPAARKQSMAGRGRCSDLARFVVAHAAMAPSGGNAQPWRFHVQGARIWLRIDRARARNLLNVDDRPAYLALGAAVENVCIAAAHRGYAVDVSPFPGHANPDVVAELALRPGQTPDQAALTHLSKLIDPLRRRITNREPGSGELLARREIQRLHAAAASRGASLALALGPRVLRDVATLVAEADRIRYLCSPLHQEMFAELRWTLAQVRRRRDGIDVATLGMHATGLAGLRLAARPDVADFLREREAGTRIGRDSARALVASASAVGMLSVARDRPEDWLRAGQAMQRVWLEAARLGLGFQPVGTLIYMLHMLATPAAAVFRDSERRALMAQKQRMDTLFPPGNQSVPVMMFRLARAPMPAVRSLRLPVDDILYAGAPPSLETMPSAVEPLPWRRTARALD